MHAPESTESPAQGSARPARDGASGWLNARRFALLLGGLVFLAFPGVALGWRTFVFRDFGLFSYPVAFFARESFRHGELPLWNPLSNCGLPFLAQWNTMVLYPPTVLYLVFPLGWALSFFCLLHLFWGGLGMYFLARRWTGYALAGAVGGIIFAFNGLTLNFLMWPSHVATFSWLPWVIWLAQEGWRAGRRKLGWAIAAASMQMLAGGPETILVTWLVLGLLATGDWLQRAAPRRMIALRFAGMGLVVGLICAAQLLPFLELLTHSQRDSGYGALARNWAMPIWGWANFLVPLFRTNPVPQGVFFQSQQYWTSSYYAGIVTVWLGLVAVRRAREWRVRVLAALVLLALLLALGDGGLVYRLLRSAVPGLELVRYPVKFVIVVSAFAPLLAALGLAALVCERRRLGGFECLMAFFLLAAVAVIVATGRDSAPELWRLLWHNGLSRAACLMAGVWFLVLIIRQVERNDHSAPADARSEVGGSKAETKGPGIRRLALGGLLLAVFYLDLITQVPNQNPTASPAVYAPEITRLQLHWNPGPTLGVSRAMASPSAQEALKYRAISDPEKNYLLQRVGLLADCNLLDEVPQVHGFFSLTPGEINDVTVVPYIQTNRDFSALLDFMGVSQITTESFESVARTTALPLVTAGQTPLFADDPETFTAFSQTNLNLGRVVFLPMNARGTISAGPMPGAKVTESRFTNRSVTFGIEAAGPCLAVISQTYYPGWKAYVDGRPAKLWRANYAFQAVEVPAGKHGVRLRYEDRSFWLGLLLSGAGLVGWAAIWWRARAVGAEPSSAA